MAIITIQNSFERPRNAINVSISAHRKLIWIKTERIIILNNTEMILSIGCSGRISWISRQPPSGI